MRSIRPAVLALALTAVAPLGLVTADVAHAADPAPAGASAGTFAILPIPSVVADGKTPVDMRFVAIDAGGKPIGGLKLKPSAAEGTAGGWSEIGPGLYGFTWTPSKKEMPGDVTITVSGKAGDKGTVDASYTVKAKPAVGSDLAGSSNPAAVVLGKTDESTLTITGGPKKGELVVNASAGKVANVTNMGEGKFTARFEAPKVNYPQLSIITVAEENDPLAQYGHVVVPLQGSVAYPVEAAPNATVILKIQGSEFGPVKASPEGTASVPIVVPPGVTKGTQVTVVDGTPSEKELDLRVPETVRMAAFPMPRAIPGDSGATIPFRVLLLTPTGEPDTGGKLTGTASKGTLGAFTHAGKGVYVAEFTPPDLDAPGTVTLEAIVEGSKVQKATLDVGLLPRRADAVTITTDPAEITADTTTVTLNVEVKGADGKGIAGRSVRTSARGGTISTPATDKGEGKYQVTVRRAEKEAEVDVVVASPPSANPVKHIMVLPQADRLDADGASHTDVVIASVDAFGYPVPGVEVNLTTTGGAKLPEKVVTDEAGVVRVQLTAGPAPALAAIEARAGRATGAGAVLLGAAGARGMPIEASMTAETAALTHTWEKLVQTVGLSVGAPSGPPPIPVLELAAAGTDAASLDVSFYPAAIPPGGTVTVRAIPKATDGKAIPGQSLDILSSNGSLGATKETGGVYETELTVTADASGEAKISVVTASGVMKLVKVPIDPNAVVAGADAVWAPNPSAGDATADAGTPEPETPAKPPKEPKEPKQPKTPKAKPAVEHPWLRARASGVGSLYSYAQEPSDDPGPLLPAPLTVGDGSRPASPVGADLNARAYVPGLPYVGALADFRFTWYSIDASVFDAPAKDWLYNGQLALLGRYPLDLDGNQVWFGGKAGFHYSDFMMFTGCLDVGCEVSYDPKGLPGLGVGVEAGADLDAAPLYVIAGYTHALANFSIPYANMVDVNVGLEVIDHVDVDLGFSWVGRKVLLLDSGTDLERGSLKDSQLAFMLGAGVNF